MTHIARKPSLGPWYIQAIARFLTSPQFWTLIGCDTNYGIEIAEPVARSFYIFILYFNCHVELRKNKDFSVILFSLAGPRSSIDYLIGSSHESWIKWGVFTTLVSLCWILLPPLSWVSSAWFSFSQRRVRLFYVNFDYWLYLLFLFSALFFYLKPGDVRIF